MTIIKVNKLSSQRLLLEPLTEQHAILLFNRLKDEQSYQYIPEQPPKSIETLRQRYKKLQQRRSSDGTAIWLNWAIRDKKAA
ncbi:GNAT family N-acetyltransferase, partial [Piscirickettsia litoralis]|uniref:GNAT family N-acetyltransferase n=1 Tax=Piscirickettsia litoralis TaxID=1891921 RepID=UPI00138FC837